MMLWCTTPEAIIRTTELSPQEATEVADIYCVKQKHDSLLHYLHQQIVDLKPQNSIFVQVGSSLFSHCVAFENMNYFIKHIIMLVKSVLYFRLSNINI